MKELKLSETHRLVRADDLNLELQEFRTVRAKPNRYIKEARETQKWVGVGYFSSVEQACSRILAGTTKVSLGTDDTQSVGELVNSINEAKQTMVQAVQNAGVGLQSFEKKTDGRGRKAVVDVAAVKGETVEETFSHGVVVK